MRYNNNPKNRKGLLDFQRRQLELSKQTEDDARKMKIASNVDKWEGSLPGILKQAKPGVLPKSLISKIKGTSLRPPYEKQVLISSSSSTVSTFVAYSILYGLIQSGIATPSEIKRTSLMDGYNNINGMFGSRRWKDNFFDKRAKVLLIEGSSKGLTHMGPKGEDHFWNELNDFTRSKDRLVIITYTTDNVERAKDLFIPTLTNDNELNTSLVRKSIFIPLTEEEEEKVDNEQEKAYRGL